MALDASSRPKTAGWKLVFVGPRGVRAGWRALAFFGFLALVVQLLGRALFALLHPATGIYDARAELLQESVQLVATLGATLLAARLERRPMATFGFDARRLLGREMLIGALWGLAAVALPVGLLAASGALRIEGLAVHGAALVEPLGLWVVGMALVGLTEELAFRGYLLWSLSRGMGFWGAAVLLAVGFGALHYFGKPMENVADFVSVSLIGLFFSLTVRRTGNLSFAIGFHFLFDWAALILFAAPNTVNRGVSLPGHLLDVRYTGPAWLTGGPLGLEAGAFIFPVIAALYLALQRAYPRALWPFEERAEGAAGR